MLNGFHCVTAVREASCHPELVQPAGLPSLLDTYTALARGGRWIECVDIARLAVCWLMGGGSTYIDTDMARGEARLPLRLVERASVVASPVQLADCPVAMFGVDVDGLVQNNVVAVASAFHPFLTLALQAVAAGAAAEATVLAATGPSLLTALYCAFGECPVGGQLTLAALALRTFPTAGGRYAGATMSHLAAAVAAPRLPVPSATPFRADASIDAAVVSLRAALPAPATEVDALWAPRLPSLPGVPPSGGAAGAARYRDWVHLATPAAFYSNGHWRATPATPAAAGAGGGGGGGGGAAPPHPAPAPASLQIGRAGVCAEPMSVPNTAEASGASGAGVPSTAPAQHYGYHGWHCTWGSGAASYAYGGGGAAYAYGGGGATSAAARGAAYLDFGARAASMPAAAGSGAAHSSGSGVTGGIPAAAAAAPVAGAGVAAGGKGRPRLGAAGGVRMSTTAAVGYATAILRQPVALPVLPPHPADNLQLEGLLTRIVGRLALLHAAAPAFPIPATIAAAGAALPPPIPRFSPAAAPSPAPAGP